MGPDKGQLASFWGPGSASRLCDSGGDPGRGTLCLSLESPGRVKGKPVPARPMFMWDELNAKFLPL